MVYDIIGVVLTSSSTPKGRATEKHKSWRVLAIFDQSERSDHQSTGSTISWTSPGFKPTGPGFGPLEWTGWAFGLNRFNHQKRWTIQPSPARNGRAGAVETLSYCSYSAPASKLHPVLWGIKTLHLDIAMPRTLFISQSIQRFAKIPPRLRHPFGIVLLSGERLNPFQYLSEN